MRRLLQVLLLSFAACPALAGLTQAEQELIRQLGPDTPEPVLLWPDRPPQFLEGAGGLIWDEGRYLTSAHYLLRAEFVSQESPEVSHGPGYPLFLAPYAAVGLPVWVMRLANVPLMATAAGPFYVMGRTRLGRSWGLALGPVLHPDCVPETMKVSVTRFISLLRTSGRSCLRVGEGWVMLALAQPLFGNLRTLRSLHAPGFV